MKLYDVHGAIDPDFLPEQEYELSTLDAAGEDRRIDLCFENVDQGCSVYARAQVRAYSPQGAVALVEKHIWPLLENRPGLDGSAVDLDAEETSEEWDFGC